MSPEEYQRIKEAEKEHLRKLREIKQASRGLRRKKSIADALGKITGSMQKPFDQHQEALDKLDQDTFQNEARLDVALMNAEDREKERAKHEQTAAFEADLQKAKAQDLVRQMKIQMGLAEATNSPQQTSTPKASEANPTPAAEPLPEKTVGRMR